MRRGHMMRRHAVLLAAALTVTLAACGSPEQEPESSGGITWDAEAQQYVMEEEIASGEAALTVWFEEETLAEAEIAPSTRSTRTCGWSTRSFRRSMLWTRWRWLVRPATAPTC